MTHADLETVYETLAAQLDEVGEDHANLFLAKLVLLLAHRASDPTPVLEAIGAAAQSLEA